MTRKKNSAITARKLSCYHNDVLYRPPVYTKHITYLDHEYSVLQLNQCPAERGKLLTFLSIILPFRSACLVIIIARKSYTNTDTKLGHSTFEMLDPADTKTYNIASRPDGGDMWLRSFKLDERFAKHDAGSEKCTGNCNVDKTPIAQDGMPRAN